MFKNYLKIAWRNLFRNKLYSGINIVGLSIGMAMALLIGLWIWDEFNINKNFSNHDQVARVLMNSTKNGQTVTLYDMPYPLAGDLRAKYTDGLKITAMMWKYSGGGMYAYKNKKVYIEGGKYAEPGMIKILPLKMIRGDEKALNEPASIIIDHFMAITIFGKEDPLNKIIIADNSHSFKVTGVFEDFPKNSAFPGLHAMVSWSEMLAEFPEAKQVMDKWDINVVEVYTLVTDMANMEKTSVKINSVLSGHGRTDHPELLLYPMNRWHLYAEFTNGKNTGGSIVFVRMFGIIGFFVLLLACINFMNLSTARSERRAREVGVRKSVGSLRTQLIIQFLGESLLITCLAIAFSLVLTYLALPRFNQLSGKQMSFPWGNPVFWGIMIAFTLLTGLLAGSYPAFYLSSFDAVKVLKGKIKAGRLASLPRQVLVVLQFTISIALIIGTLVVFEEIQFAKNRPMGYDRHNLISVFRNTPESFKNFRAIRQDLLAIRAIDDITLANGPAVALYDKLETDWDWPGKDPGQRLYLGLLPVAQNFGKTVKWNFIAGRDFSTDHPTDSMGIVLNESAVKHMGLKNPVGALMGFQHNEWFGLAPGKKFQVIGVIQDMVMESPFEPVVPILYIMKVPEDQLFCYTIRLNPSIPFARSIAMIEPVFKKYNPAVAFFYYENDEDYSSNFLMENRIGVLSLVFAAFAIFISCLGLFGLASFTAEQRTREIGIRKVLGASLLNLWQLLSKEYLLLVMIALCVALPLSWFFMHNWLQRYDYRTPISIWIFFGTMAIAFIITMITVSFQSIRVSMANPVTSLRTE
jgi:putative ABC transport system permease protein